jgi:phage protein D
VTDDSLRVEIGGAEIDGLYADLRLLEVELDDELTAMCRLTLALTLLPDGSWTYLDDDRFAPWQTVKVVAGLEDDTRELLTGYVTHVRPEFAEGLDQCLLEVWAMDSGILLDRADVVKDWPNKKDSDIAVELFSAHGLDYTVTDTAVVHDEKISTIIQRETDLQFLQRLALRNGFECYVEGRTGHFGPTDDAPRVDLPVLAVQFGDATNVTRFALEVNALAPSTVVMTQVDRLTGQALDATSQQAVAPALGAKTPAHLLGEGMPAGLLRVGQTVATGNPEMTALCQGLHDRGEWFVNVEGEVDAHRYGGVLVPRATVVVKGIGKTHSGRYRVARVTHSFTPDGYVQGFTLRRNALGLTGTEDFGADAAVDLGGVAGLAVGAALAGVLS